MHTLPLSSLLTVIKDVNGSLICKLLGVQASNSLSISGRGTKATGGTSTHDESNDVCKVAITIN